MAVRERGEYLPWVTFFCSCLLSSAEDSVSSLEWLVELRNRSVTTVNARLGRSAANGQQLLTLLEGHPIVDIGFVAEKLGVSRTPKRLCIATGRSREPRQWGSSQESILLPHL